MDTVAALRKYNRWRRGMDGDSPDYAPDPRSVGEQIDAACDELERLRVIEEAAKNLVAQKGRHHTEQAYQRLAELVVPNKELTGANEAAMNDEPVKVRDDCCMCGGFGCNWCLVPNAK